MTEPEPGRRLCPSGPTFTLPYDRARVRPGIVHLGVGAFCRAHLAVYVDDVLASDPTWGIVGISLKRPTTRDALAPQGSLYTLAVCGESGMETRVIGALLQVLDATTQLPETLATLAEPDVRIVSLTVTEKGYCHDPATGALDVQHPDIMRDLAQPYAPVSAPGLLVRALELRRAAGLAPFTVLCCDNLPSNGETAARVVAGFADLRAPELGDFIRREVSFPSTMVDRIVPATTEDDRRRVQEATGRYDAWPVMTEPFTQWVVEDRFSSARPPFELAGVQMVSDVRPYELTKLRLLNGSHSALAYLGYLAGYELVSEAIADADMRTFIQDFMTDEVMSTLPGGVGDLAAYRDALLERFANPALRHRTWQIAMDGSQKLPQRLLGTIRDRLARNLPVTRAALGVAGWMRYVSGIDERGREIDVRDPLVARLREIASAASGSPKRLVEGLLGVSEVFGGDLPRDDSFRSVLTGHLLSLFDRGALATVRDVTRSSNARATVN